MILFVDTYYSYYLAVVMKTILFLINKFIFEFLSGFFDLLENLK